MTINKKYCYGDVRIVLTHFYKSLKIHANVDVIIQMKLTRQNFSTK